MAFPPVSANMFLISTWDLTRITCNIHISSLYFKTHPAFTPFQVSKPLPHVWVLATAAPCFSIPLSGLAYTAQVKCCRPGGLNYRNLYFHKIKVLEAGCPASGLVSGESCLPDLPIAVFLLCFHMVERESKLSDVSSCKGTNSIMKAPPSWPPNYLPRARSPNINILRVRAST